jgi:uncharacterized membrane protein required for colicin V production
MDSSAHWPAPLDLIGLGLVSILLLLGVYRGLWWQVMRLVGVIVSFLVARAVGATLAVKLVALFPDLEPRTAHGIAWGVLFLTALLACALLGHLGQRLLEAMQLGLVNRLAGGAAGAATGLAIHVAVVVLICQLAPAQVLGRHVAGTWSERLYFALGIERPVVIASEGAREVDAILETEQRLQAGARAEEDRLAPPASEPPTHASPPADDDPGGAVR